MIPGFDHLPLWAKLSDLLLHLALGFGVGRVYFDGVWRTAQLFASRPAAAIGWTLLRFGLLAGILTVTALEGALPLLCAALGIVLARPGVLRRAQ